MSRDNVLAAMGLAPLADDRFGPNERALRVLLQPTFHRHVCITVRVVGDVASVELVVLGEGGAAGVTHDAGGFEGPAHEAPRTRSTTLPASVVATSLRDIDEIDRSALGVGLDEVWRDGIGVRGEIAEAAGSVVFEPWPPGAAATRFARVMLDLARAHVDDDALTPMPAYL